MTNRSAMMMIMIVFAISLSAVSQSGAVPALINYQGELRDAQGSPLDDVYRMVFQIYNVPTDGSALWGEEQMIDVNGGIYNVYLGAGAKITTGDDLGPTIFSSGDRWLEVSIEGETLTPRQRISSVAFAFRASEALYAETAGNSDSLDGKDSTDFAGSDHDHTGADITSGIIADPRIASSIARDSEITWGNLNGIPADIANGDQVGITTETDPTITDSSIKDGVSWSELSGIPGGFNDGIDNIGITSESDPQVGSNTTNYVPKWNGSALTKGSIYDNGNIGIGTSNPLKPLHVIGVSGQLLNRPSGMEAYESLLVENNNNSNIVLLAKYTADSSLKFADDTRVNSGQIKYLHSQDRMAFFTNATNQMNITSNGNVGIGTTSPSSSIEIEANSPILTLDTNGSLAALDFKKGDSTKWRMGWNSGSSYLYFWGGGGSGTSMVLEDVTGNVGIGVADPDAKLDVKNTTNNYYTIYGKHNNGNVGHLASEYAGAVGVHGSSGNFGRLGDSTYGVYGKHQSSGNYGYLGSSVRGVVGVGGTGVFGSGADYGVWAQAFGTGGVGLYAKSTDGYAAVFEGPVEITGGSDLSEPFNIGSNSEMIKPEPGMVVVIDPQHPGELRVSTTAYDRKVAGIISGAGGIGCGMVLRQKDSKADGKFPVALTGRVYCLTDASQEEIVPGDLLTTSQTPGHAMKVGELAHAQGAIIGKAMTPLKSGTGLVLVLVNLH